MQLATASTAELLKSAVSPFTQDRAIILDELNRRWIETTPTTLYDYDGHNFRPVARIRPYDFTLHLS